MEVKECEGCRRRARRARPTVGGWCDGWCGVGIGVGEWDEWDKRDVPSAVTGVERAPA
jgi:hypothetical protein